MSEVTEKQKFLDDAAMFIMQGIVNDVKAAYDLAEALWNERQKRYGGKDG